MRRFRTAAAPSLPETRAPTGRPARPEDAPEFLAALRRGDERAFAALVGLYQHKVVTLCHRILGGRNPEEAADLAQDVFVTVHGKLHTFRGDSGLGSWILRVAANHAKNRVKYLARRRDRDRTALMGHERHSADSRFQSPLPGPAEMLDRERLHAWLSAALERLEPEQRELVVLRDMQGLSYEELVELTGLPLGTVKSRLHRARALLARDLEARRRRARLEVARAEAAGQGASASAVGSPGHSRDIAGGRR